MSATTTHTPPRGPALFVGMLAAFASFAVVSAVLQWSAGGKPADPTSEVRIKNRDTIRTEQDALLKKSGILENADAVIAKSVEQIKQRKAGETKIVVPGSPTAVKQAAAAPAPAAAAPAPASQPKP